MALLQRLIDMKLIEPLGAQVSPLAAALRTEFADSRHTFFP
jgi:hypothetical protein